MRRLLLLAAATLVLTSAASAQDDWRFTGEITFPVSGDDTVTVRPFLSTVDANGTLWVISSNATDTLAHNALWRAEVGASEFTLVQDYTAMDDPNVVRTVGIASHENNIIVSNYRTLLPLQTATFYYYRDGEVAQRLAFEGAGYGTFINGIDATDEGYLYAAMTFQSGIRVYDYRPGSETFGQWIPQDPSYSTELGGHDPDGVSTLREIAVIPGGDYTDPETPFYTARNAAENYPARGIAQWTGATPENWNQYTSTRIGDAAGDLDLSRFIMTGITADSKGQLWVSGPDSSRRWVKAFEVIGDAFAFEVLELPSSTSMSNPVSGGAPFSQPNDVALNEQESRAYVIDRAARRAWVFERTVVSTEPTDELPARIALHQNYPNPFNPATTIKYHIAEAGPVRLVVTDLLGREVAVLAEGVRVAGDHTVVFDAAGLASGVYFYRLEALGGQVNRVLMLSK